MFEIADIQRILPHRYPFLLLDRVLELEPGLRGVAVKCVSINEPFFQGHFPGRPVMPGVLVVEAMAQLAGVVALSASAEHAGQAVYLMGLDAVRFRKPVVPGDRLILRCEKTYDRRRICKFSAVAEVEGVKVAEAVLMATLAESQAEDAG